MTDRAARNLLIVLTIAVAATRVAALSHSMWDWDEALFSSGVRHYNVKDHNPHPPGFPLFIAAAKCVRWVVGDDFRALRTLNLIVSSLIFPVMYLMARAYGFAFSTSVVGALIYAFLPNVVFWGGTAMSDVAAAVIFAAAAALLLRSTSTRSFIGGSIAFAASMLIRPQNAIAAYPWFLASVRQVRERGRRGVATAVVAAVLVIAIVGGGYAIAALVTGWSDYFDAVRKHGTYVAAVDGFREPHRPPSLSPEMIYRFLVNPVHARGVPLIALAALVAVAIPRRRHFDLLATYVPQMLFALFMLNPKWATRFAIAYWPAHAILAASALGLLLGFLASAARLSPRVVAPVEWTIGAGAAVFSALWVWPAIRETRRHDSPPVQAMRWISTHLRPESAMVYVHTSLASFAEYYLPRYRVIEVDDSFQASAVRIEGNSWYAADHPSFGTHPVCFRREESAHLVRIYNRYYEACVAPIDVRILFGGGWYEDESNGDDQLWRWMGRAAHVTLGSLGGPGRLTLRMHAPTDILAGQTLTVRVGEQVIDRYPIGSAELERSYDLTIPQGGRAEVTIEVDKTVVPKAVHRGDDERELGLQLQSLTWVPRQ